MRLRNLLPLILHFFFPFANEDENTDTEEIEKKGTSKKEISTEETPKEGSIYLPDLVEMEPAPHVLKKKEPSKQRVRSPSKTALASRKKNKACAKDKQAAARTGLIQKEKTKSCAKDKQAAARTGLIQKAAPFKYRSASC